jgi:hypothetical protein
LAVSLARTMVPSRLASTASSAGMRRAPLAPET